MSERHEFEPETVEHIRAAVAVHQITRLLDRAHRAAAAVHREDGGVHIEVILPDEELSDGGGDAHVLLVVNGDDMEDPVALRFCVHQTVAAMRQDLHAHIAM
jgi:hypothetical protein